MLITGHRQHVPLSSSLPAMGKLRCPAGQGDDADGFVSRRVKPSELKRLVEMESTKERWVRHVSRFTPLPHSLVEDVNTFLCFKLLLFGVYSILQPKAL